MAYFIFLIKFIPFLFCSRGEMAFSYCWRYKCLPTQFSTSNFTATVSQLDRFNIKRMPGGVVYNTTLKVR